jgi:hypothetical protein
MGYCMDQSETVFNIAKENISSAVKSIQDLHGKETIQGGSGRHFSWVDEDFYKQGDLTKILNAWRWNPNFDMEGNVVNIEFTGEKLGDDQILFDAIAPFVKEGSYIEMRGEDGAIWRWVFDGKTCEEKQAKISWEY